MKENINTILLVVIAATVIYGTFIKEDSPRVRRSSKISGNIAAPAQNPGAITPNFTPPANNQPAPPPKPTNPPTQVKFGKMAHSFGNIKQDTENKHVFKFTNTGDKPLIIESATGSCGCTVPEYPKEPIPPGQEGEIKVVYKPGKQKGNQNKTVTIIANTEPRETRLNISAVVEETAPAQ